ncbi:MAG: PadR family transcriptional regulator [Hyphomicrobiales bacterium]|nr:MAG: PadR family transcriptional regulator [Hyphomicrobiales bacterium]
MSLRYALLALLTAEPLTGYDAAKRFSGSVGHVWHAPDSQIYPELRRMEQAGLIDGKQVPWGPRSTKKQYSITDLGIEAFREWMCTPIEYTPARNVHHLQAAYFEWTDTEHARAHLQNHIDYYAAQLAQWKIIHRSILDRTNPTMVKRTEKYPAEQHEHIVAFKAFAYEGMISLAQTEIDWAQKGLSLLDRIASSDVFYTTEPTGQ